jgi:hypothetical protein
MNQVEFSAVSHMGCVVTTVIIDSNVVSKSHRAIKETKQLLCSFTRWEEGLGFSLQVRNFLFWNAVVSTSKAEVQNAELSTAPDIITKWVTSWFGTHRWENPNILLRLYLKCEWHGDIGHSRHQGRYFEGILIRWIMN